MHVPRLKMRDTDSHKGTFGRALLIGGSRGMTGAPALAGIAALKSGAGLVTVAVPDRCLESVAAHNMCFMTVPIPDDASGRFDLKATEPLSELCATATSVGIGPGMSRSPHITEVVKSLYLNYPGPMVVDADALNALAEHGQAISRAAGPRVLTPHIGEFRRLVNKPELSPADCRALAPDFARQHQLIVVLKGPNSLVTDGDICHENKTGNPGMATGGSGDVLTGITTALLGQKYTPLEATVLAVHVHGIAGDIARDTIGEVSMTAADIADCLPNAFRQLSAVD